MKESAFSPTRLNRTLLERQMLLQRTGLDVPAALERMGGLQMQYAPSGYIGLWSRVADFRRGALTHALESRQVVQATLMRATIHLVSAADYPLLAAATRRARREWWIRTQARQLDGIDVERVEARVRELLAPGPLRQAEIQTTLAQEGIPRLGWAGVSHWMDLVRVPPSGTWTNRRADLYGLAETWLGAPSRDATELEEAGRELLIRRYLGAFGPAPLPDVAAWAGVPAADLRRVADAMELSRYPSHGGELLDLPDAPLPDAETPAPVRFLPTWDATLLVHARRTGILPEAYRPLVFNTRTPHSVPIFLVDGAVAGTWRYEKDRVRIEPFAAVSGSVMADLEAEAAGLEALHAESDRSAVG